MTTVLDKPRVATTQSTEVFYSLCPGPLPSHIAVEKGWTQEELARKGGALSFLRAIPDPESLWPHVGHRSDALIREGSNHPPVWARADVSDTRVVATMQSYRDPGQIVVRVDSDISRLEDLAGKRIGLIKGQNTAKLDFIRAPSHRGVLQALKVGGLTQSDVDIVDTPYDDHKVEEPSRNPEERNARLSKRTATGGADVQALDAGQVDAIFSAGAKTLFLERTGKYKVIHDLAQHPDWTLGGAAVSVITVSAKLAQERPELVVAWLRAALRGARWVHENRREAAEIFARVATHYPSVADLYATIAPLDFTPTFSPQLLAGLELQKSFLLENGYIENDFAISDWVETRFLQEAHDSL